MLISDKMELNQGELNGIYIMLGIVISYYWIMAFIVFSMWFKVFWADETTAKNDLSSWMVLIIGASFWVVVLPFANLELVIKAYSIHN